MHTNQQSVQNALTNFHEQINVKLVGKYYSVNMIRYVGIYVHTYVHTYV